MKIDKYSAILRNTVGYHDMSLWPAIVRPPYRLIEYQRLTSVSSLASNAGIRSVLGFSTRKYWLVFDHIRSGKNRWGLSTLLSRYYLGIYNTPVENTTVGPEYYQQLLTYLKQSGSNQTVAF